MLALFDKQETTSKIEQSQETLVILHESQFLTTFLRILSSYLAEQAKNREDCEIKWVKIDESLSLEEQLRIIENTENEQKAFKYSTDFEQFAKAQLLIMKKQCALLELYYKIQQLCIKIKEVME